MSHPPIIQTGLGIVAPHDMALDREMWRWAPEDVTLYFTRTEPNPGAATVEMIEDISKVDKVTSAMRTIASPDAKAFAYACTSCSFVRGLAGNTALIEGMKSAGAPAAVTTSGALVEALVHLGVGKVATVTPYNKPLTDRFERFLAEGGLGLTGSMNLGITTDIRKVPYPTTRDLIRKADHPDAEAICVACTNLATYDVIAELEAELDKPIVTANQATMWASLRLIDRVAVGEGQRLINA